MIHFFKGLDLACCYLPLHVHARGTPAFNSKNRRDRMTGIKSNLCMLRSLKLRHGFRCRLDDYNTYNITSCL